MGFLDENGAVILADEVKTYVGSTAVAKEDGKGLSTNDYTNAEKNKLDGLNKDLLDKLGESADNNLTFNGEKISAAQMTGATAETDGTAGTVTAPKAGEQAKFLRGDGTWAEATGGTKISPKATVNPAIKSGNAKCTITWGDPEDVIADGVVLSTWKGTKLVMNETNYPEDENDGTVIVDNKSKNAYVSTGYEVTGLTNGKTYYFKLFPYSTDGIYNYQDTNKLLGNPSLVKLDPCTNMNVTVTMGSATVTWTDPEETKTVDGITATWAKTVLVYKQDSTAPISVSDGTVAVEETTRNQYASSGYEVTGLTDGQQYTFALFAVSTENSVSESVSANVQLWATLNITTTETTLYGKNVSATNSTSTVTGTFSSTGSVSLNIPWIGSTIITATDGTDTGDDIVNITAYMNMYSLQFTFVPDGETVTPTDDVTILLKCAEVKGTDYTTIAEVLADDSAMYEITAHEESMKYLARSTSFADDLCADETFMTYLGSSAYVDATILNSDIWVSAICDSTYFELVLNVKVPTMTSNTKPSGEVSASSTHPGYETAQPYTVFKGYINADWGDNTKIWISNQLTNAWIQYKFTNPVCIKMVAMVPCYYGNLYRVKDFIIQGSNDNFINDINNLYTGTSVSSSSWKTVPDIYTFLNNKKYSYYRLFILNNYPNVIGQEIAVDYLQFYGR